MVRKAAKRKPQVKGKKRASVRKTQKTTRKRKRCDGYYVLDKIYTPIDY